MDRLQAMKTFVRVAETGGFAEAARQLRMSPPAVTRFVAALEEAIGTRLLTRTTRTVKLTEAGAHYLEDCRRILADMAEAEAAAAGSYATPTGSLRITASVMFGHMHVLPILTEFLDRHPAVTGDALFLDRVVNIVDEGIDVAVRIGHLPDSGFSAIRVGEVRHVVCGSPAYFKAHGVPQKPADLATHRTMTSTGAWMAWRFADSPNITVQPRLFTNTVEGALLSAEQGWGLTRVLSYQAAPALAAGRLQRVLADYEEPPIPVHVIHAEGRRASAKVRTFVDFAVEKLRANPMINQVG